MSQEFNNKRFLFIHHPASIPFVVAQYGAGMYVLSSHFCRQPICEHHRLVCVEHVWIDHQWIEPAIPQSHKIRPAVHQQRQILQVCSTMPLAASPSHVSPLFPFSMLCVRVPVQRALRLRLHRLQRLWMSARSLPQRGRSPNQWRSVSSWIQKSLAFAF